MSYDTELGVEIVICPACDGQGERQVADITYGPHTGPYGDPTPTGIQCEECRGTGKIESSIAAINNRNASDLTEGGVRG